MTTGIREITSLFVNRITIFAVSFVAVVHLLRSNDLRVTFGRSYRHASRTQLDKSRNS